MKAYRRKKWFALAALTIGTAMQLSTCREDLALFGLRTAFSSVTLPINELIRAIIFGAAV